IAPNDSLLLLGSECRPGSPPRLGLLLKRSNLWPRSANPQSSAFALRIPVQDDSHSCPSCNPPTATPRISAASTEAYGHEQPTAAPLRPNSPSARQVANT